MFTERDVVNISLLNQCAYCPRRCGLIHVEGVFADNIHTSRGSAEHERVDRIAHETLHTGARVEYALPVWSERLGLIGKCDVVEFWPDGTIYPIEYKHGPKRKWLNDDLQVAAQAMCLEEMFSCDVPRGAIFHVASHRRREVVFDVALRDAVVGTVNEILSMSESRSLPPPVNDRRCKECSMREICQPEAIGKGEVFREAFSQLFFADAE